MLVLVVVLGKISTTTYLPPLYLNVGGGTSENNLLSEGPVKKDPYAWPGNDFKMGITRFVVVVVA